MANSVVPPQVRIKLSLVSGGLVSRIWARLGAPAPSDDRWKNMWEDLALVAKEVLEESK